MEIDDIISRPTAKVSQLAVANAQSSLETAREPVWYLIDSNVLGDRFVYCTDRKALKDVREEFPETAIYFPPEMAELIALEETLSREDWLDLVAAVHRLKKRFRGWVVPKRRTDAERA